MGLNTAFAAAHGLRAVRYIESFPYTKQKCLALPQGQMFEPGTRFDYVLTNWILVIAAIEAVTGLPYQEAMRRITIDRARVRRRPKRNPPSRSSAAPHTSASACRSAISSVTAGITPTLKATTNASTRLPTERTPPPKAMGTGERA